LPEPLAVVGDLPQDGVSPGTLEATMDQARAQVLLDEERARLQRLLRAGISGPDAFDPDDVGDEVDNADRRDAEETGAAVDELLRDRWAALKRAEARLAAGDYGRSIRSGRPIPDERLEADPLAELTVEEAAAGEAGEVEPGDEAAGLKSARHPFEVLNDADITPEEQLADEDDDEPAPARTQGINVERDDRRR
jgi:RNA polymerase-binding transcription factor